MLANAEGIHARAIRQLRLRDDVAQGLGVADERPVGVDRDIPEGVQTEFE